MLLIAAAIGAGGAAGVLRAADARTADVERIDGLTGVLADIPDDDVEYAAENYLLVGSDSREGIIAGTDDYDFVGDTARAGMRQTKRAPCAFPRPSTPSFRCPLRHT